MEEVTTAADGSVTIVGDWRSNHTNGRSAFTFSTTDGKIASITIREA